MKKRNKLSHILSRNVNINILSNKRLVSLAIVIFIFLAWSYLPTINDYIVVSTYSGPENIKILADKSGMNTHGKAIFYSTSPELVNSNTLLGYCPNQQEDSVEYGCYLPSSNKIYILKIGDDRYAEIEYTIAAHEMLHVAWSKLSDSERLEVGDSLNKFYSDEKNLSAKQLHEMLSIYPNDTDVLTDELHSFVGSTMSSGPSSLDRYYGKYFFDRGLPAGAYFWFNAKVESERAAIKAEYDAIDKLANELNEFKSRWLDSFVPIINRNLYYGDIATYNINVNAYNNNLQIYNDKLKKYKERADAYNARVQVFNAFVDSLYSKDTLPSRSSQ